MAETKTSPFRFRQSFFTTNNRALHNLDQPFLPKALHSGEHDAGSARCWSDGFAAVGGWCVWLLLLFFSAKDRQKNNGENSPSFFLGAPKRGLLKLNFGGYPPTRGVSTMNFTTPSILTASSIHFLLGNIIAAASSSSSNHHFSSSWSASSSNPTNLKEFSGNKKMQKIP